MDQHDLKKFNQKLIDDFGYHPNGDPLFRLVWSDDQLEKRKSNYSEHGILLSVPQIIEVPKYRQTTHQKWILEYLTVLPDNHEELAVGRFSYEPVWTFQTKDKVYIEPRYEAAKFLINNLLDKVHNRSSFARYANTTEEERQARIKEIDEIEKMLYGEETKVGDALMKDSAVGYGTRNRNDSFNPQEKLNNLTLGE